MYNNNLRYSRCKWSNAVASNKTTIVICKKKNYTPLTTFSLSLSHPPPPPPQEKGQK